MIYLQLFLSFLQIGLFSFGGGYAAMPLIQDQVVTRYGWLSMAEFTDLITISQMTPGPIAVNGAIVVGFQMAGIPGLLISVLATVLPPFVILSLISLCYTAFRSNLYFGSLSDSFRQNPYNGFCIHRYSVFPANRNLAFIFFGFQYKIRSRSGMQSCLIHNLNLFFCHNLSSFLFVESTLAPFVLMHSRYQAKESFFFRSKVPFPLSSLST
mgnify:CR=1 FL=1